MDASMTLKILHETIDANQEPSFLRVLLNIDRQLVDRRRIKT